MLYIFLTCGKSNVNILICIKNELHDDVCINSTQVSKCEKFGYGYMVTQVAATAPGMIALQKTGNLI